MLCFCRRFHMKRPVIITIVLLVILCLFFSAAGHATSQEQESSDPRPGNTHIVVTFLGDCTLGSREQDYDKPTSFIAYAEKYGLEYFFSQVQDIIAHDDLTVANLEGVFSDDGTKETRGKTYCFRAPVSYAKMLPLSSIEAVSFGNNHSMDYGISGALDTIAALEANGIGWFGANPDYDNLKYPEGISRTWIYEKDGIRIGFASSYISAWWIKSSDYHAEYKIQKKQIEELKEQGCDLIIVCMHGGVEYGGIHDDNQEKFANAYFQYGADIIIGTHPHRLQGIEVNEKGTVCYSLGNFCFGGNMRIHKHAETTCIFQFDLEFDENHVYQGYTLTLYPAIPGSFVDDEFSDFQPKLVTDKSAKDILYEIQRDTYPRTLKLNPYVEGVGAVQDFVPNPKLKR
ncbi:MAG: hypothetical protein CW338_03100 [Clostridiales bacterium]|nr:hypothetical protein [Clostridiales bacterium]